MAQKNGGPNLTRRLIAVGASGAFTPILATGPTRAWHIQESQYTNAGAANASQGLLFQIPNDGTASGFQTTFARGPAYPEFENFNKCSQHGPHGEVFGGAGGPAGAGIGTTPATLLVNVSSLTATPTYIEIVEYF